MSQGMWAIFRELIEELPQKEPEEMWSGEADQRDRRVAFMK